MLASKLYYSGTLAWSTRCGPSECRLLYWVLAWDLDTAVCPMSGLWGQCLGRLKSSKKITVWFEYCSKMVKTEGPEQRPGVPCTFVILLDDLSVVLWSRSKIRLSHVPEWQKLRKRRSTKSLDSTANFKPEQCYFVLILMFVAIYAFYETFINF